MKVNYEGDKEELMADFRRRRKARSPPIPRGDLLERCLLAGKSLAYYLTLIARQLFK